MFKSIIISLSLLLFSGYSLAQIDGGNGGGNSNGGGAMGGSQFPDENTGEKFGDLDDVDRRLNDLSRSTTKARPRFAALFDHAQTAILKNDLKKAEPLRVKLHEINDLNAYEESRLHLIDYWYYGKQGNQGLEYEAASKLLAVGAGSVDSHAFVEAGMRLLKRQYNNQDFGGAIETLTNLRKDGESLNELMSIVGVVKKLDDLAEQKTDIVLKITTNNTGVWSTKLLKSSFLFGEIQGEVTALGFNCTNKQTSIAYKVNSAMEIPDAWGACVLTVTAKPNTVFNFVQLQQKPH